MFESFEITSSYTRKEAIADGYQVEIPEEIWRKLGFKCRIFVTRPIYDFFIEESPASDAIPALLRQVLHEIRKDLEGGRICFEGYVPSSDAVRSMEVFVEIGAVDVDDADPSLTIMSHLDI